ncbi:hypothetical protein BA896_021945 [Janthinobacterium lividum]|uniref:Uncharacterized protein n=1 Tax=Janthinobacterium lividum TaxID=29581 RepID=A0A1E8PKK9_9BURK|nr:hypothetical protein BA896_021945 [Janthinobacterium lividum]
MHLYRIQVTGAAPARYRGIVGATEAQAIAKAQSRHQAAGHALVGHQFQVTDCRLIVCSSVVEHAACAVHTVGLTDDLLAAVEMALDERVRLLESRIARTQEKGQSPDVLTYQKQLAATQQAIALVAAA